MEENLDSLKDSDSSLLQDFVKFKEALLVSLKNVVIGQDNVLEEILCALFAGGHILITGVPGLGKTHIVRSIANSLSLTFNRIQFTPDLMPSDIIGSEVLQQYGQNGSRIFEFSPGPIFANIVLADEINRTSPKTQAAMLEAMQERQVTVGGRRYELDEPFFVLATQNPIEQEGTYPLPEAQLDRFIFCSLIDYPKVSDEIEMVLKTTSENQTKCAKPIAREVFLKYLALMRRIPVPRRVAELAVKIVRKTRPQTKTSAEMTQQYVEWGAGPRASQAIVLASKTFAALAGRSYASFADVERAAFPVLRKRVKLNYLAQADGIDVDLLTRKIVREATQEIGN